MAWRNRLSIVLAVVLVTVSLTPTAMARDERETYTTGADVVTSCSEDFVGGLLSNNYGSVCFDVRETETTLDVAIDDFNLNGVGGAIQFLDADGEQVDELVNFCGSIADVPIPAEAESMEIYVNGPTLQLVHCDDAAAGTTGEVIVTLTD